MFNKKNQIVVAVDKKKLDNPNEIADTVKVAKTNELIPYDPITETGEKPPEPVAVVQPHAEETFAEYVAAETTFKGECYAYGVIKSEHRKYDVVRVKIDPATLQSIAERIGKSHDSENRAFMEMQSAMAADMVIKKKEEARITKLKQKEMAALNNG